jgi:GTPase SAR1 family protein
MMVHIQLVLNLVRKYLLLVKKMSNFKFGMYVYISSHSFFSKDFSRFRLPDKKDFDQLHVVITVVHPVPYLSMIFQGKIKKTFFFLISNEFFSSRESYTAITNWLTDVRALASPNIVIILCGNKKDLEGESRQVTYLEATRFAQEHGRIIFSLIICYIK